MTLAHAGDAKPILRGDPRYEAFASRGDKRFAGRPEAISVVGSTAQTVAALQEAVREGKRVAARSGGHCLEAFVASAEVERVIDMSPMTGVRFDETRRAFEIQPGTTVGEAYRQLFEQWGVVVPCGIAPSVGMGGHILGGAFGYLCRQHGLASDHLHGVEVALVNAAGEAHAVIVSCEDTGANLDLWWAHTGGGGGNFGIVTRYWLRSPEAHGTDPCLLLPRAPEAVLSFNAAWDWSSMDEQRFVRLGQGFGRWCEQNSAPGALGSKLYSVLSLTQRSAGKLSLSGMVNAGSASPSVLREHLQALNEAVGVPCVSETHERSWLEHALDFPTDGPIYKLKDASLRRSLTEAQLQRAFVHLTREDSEVSGGLLGMASYGGQVNAKPPAVSATAQRDTIIRLSCTAGWQRAEQEADNMRWLRELYRDLFAETGGVPVPNSQTAGAIINHPDVDLADPAWNTSGVPWHQLYYGDNYPRLQRVKARWDPRHVFRHALSIEPA